MKIRAKLSFLLALVMALAVIPYSYLGLRQFSRASMDNEKARFLMLGAVAGDQLNFCYYTFLLGEVQEITKQKEQLNKISRLVIRNWANLDILDRQPRDYLIDRQLTDLKRLGMTLGFFTPRSGLTPIFQTAGFDWNMVSDYTGRPLLDQLSPEKLSLDGHFSVFSVQGRGLGAGGAFLGLIMPDEKREKVLVNLVSISEIKKQSALSTDIIAAEFQANLAELPLGEASSVSLVDARGRRLAYRGKPTFQSPNVLSKARQLAHLEELAGPPDQRILTRVEYFRPLDWFIVMETPESGILAPARAMVRRMLTLGAVVMLAGLIMSLVSARFFTRPLLALSRKAASAAELDFTSSEAEVFFQADDLSRRKDEIGQLTASFLGMGRTIAQNVKLLVAGAKIQERLAGELSAARDIQLGILPSPEEAPREENFQVAAFLQPAKEVGGDFYDFFTAPGGQRVLVIGDVSDKGVPAALFMTMVCTLVRRTIASGLNPDEALRQINEQLNERNPGSMFVTLFIGLFNPADGRLVYANGGHCPPVIIGPGGQVRQLEDDSPDPLVGAWPGLSYHLRQAALDPGECCLLYTDGITEAQDDSGGFFGDDRLLALAAGRAEGPADPEGLIRRVYDEVALFRGAAPQSDDITMLAFRAGPPAANQKANT